MNSKISIIVPIYNSSVFLRRCLDSLINQTYQNLEIILINDGSTDDSELICKEYITKYENVTLFNKRNGGLGSARNKGLDLASGDYVGFVDSDDWVDYDYFEGLLNLQNQYHADISSYEIDVTSTYKMNLECENINNVEVLEKEEKIDYYFKNTLKDSNLFSVCTTLFKKELLENIRFREGKLNEDMDFKLKALNLSERWVKSKCKKYHYYQSGNSLSSGIIKTKDLDLLEASVLLLEIASKYDNPSILKYAEIGCVKPYFSLLIRLSVYGCTAEVDKKNLEKRCLSEIRGNYIRLICSPIKISRKLLITAYCLNPHIIGCVLRVLNKLRQ